MTGGKRGLGRGLDALLGQGASAPVEQSFAFEEQQTDDVKASSVQELSVSSLRPCRYQPRKQMNDDALDDLANSIREHGVIQPIVVQKVSDGHYEIIAGERRWRASQMAGLAKVPVVVKDVAPQSVLAISLIENIQREDLNPIEEATAIAQLHDEFELTHEEIAKVLGKSRTTITNFLRLLKLEPDVIEMINSRQLDMGHARALLSLSGAQQIEIAQKVADKQLSVRQTEQLVKAAFPAGGKVKPEKVRVHADILGLQSAFEKKLSTKIDIKSTKKGSGKLVVYYNDLTDLDSLLERIS